MNRRKRRLSRRSLAGVWLAAAFAAADPAPAPLDALAREVRRDLGPGYTIEPVEDLFVAATNADRAKLEECRGTVGRAYRSLCRTYFDTKPDRPIAIYLFRDAASYEAYCVRRNGEKPSTPYGFYWPAERKLVMDISTGTGTLVHELVHPFIAADFPDAPPWLNEGLASLYEQCRIEEETGTLKGLVNWRLPGLQAAIGEDRLIPLAKLLAMTSDEFYEATRLPYAEARYLCMYLQEKGQLVTFYKRFREAAAAPDAAARDATGVRTLPAVTGRTLPALEKEWTAWAKTLKYR